MVCFDFSYEPDSLGYSSSFRCKSIFFCFVLGLDGSKRGMI